MNHTYDAIVVGGGVAGLTAAAYLAKAGKSVLLCEKEEHCGGLVNSFERGGFRYDGGVRALENSGMLFPMLKQLGISLDFVPNVISMGIEDRVISLESDHNLQAYKALLDHFYPQSRNDIEQIIGQMRVIMQYMDVQYGIDNPIFLDMKANQEYMLKVVLPWMFKYAITAPKIAKINQSTVEYLKRYTSNQSLLDIIAQHFFKETPAYFALSYMKLYLDYHYPRGGTGVLVSKLVELITKNNGVIHNNTQIVELDAEQRSLKDQHGETVHYRRLVWAADQQSLYRLLKVENIPDSKVRERIQQHKELISEKTGNDSVYTLFAAVNLPPEYFAQKCSAHFFYTPSRQGQSASGPIPIGQGRPAIEKWLERFLSLTTYEISIPVLRDEQMAPPGKSGLIISLLFDYSLAKHIQEQGWYDDLKRICEQNILRVLNQAVFPGIEAAVEDAFSSTPLTLQKLTANHQGAITGWAFSNNPMPAESRLPKIMNAIQTPIPGVYQAGQWTFSPSGLPVSLLTGKLAADRILKDLKRQ